jgi:hypothetical protein
MSKFGGFGSSGSAGGQVILNVYDLNDNNAILYPWGFGMFHSGVQIGREEYTFGKLDLISCCFLLFTTIVSSVFFRNLFTRTKSSSWSCLS